MPNAGSAGALYTTFALMSVAGGGLDLGGNVMLVEVWTGDPSAVIFPLAEHIIHELHC